MSKLPKFIQIILLAVLAIFSLVTASIYFKLKSLPYNSEGRYFDSNESIVYLEQDLLSYAVISVFSLILFSILMFYFIKSRQEKTTKK